jgi:hypothetical protein
MQSRAWPIQGDSGEQVGSWGSDIIVQREKKKIRKNLCLILIDYGDEAV